MPSFMLGKALNIVVGAKFPGGMEGWTQAGCDLMALPNPKGKDVVYILVPEDTTASMDLLPFKEAIEEAAKRYAFEARWSSTPNFDGLNPAEIKARLEGPIASARDIIKPGQAALTLHRAGILVIIMNWGDEEEASKILDLFEGVEGLDRAVAYSEKALVERVYRKSTGLQAEVGLDHVISEGDVADLKIMLHEADTVEDFLKGL